MSPDPSSGPAASGGGPARELDATALARLRELDPDQRHGVLKRVLSTFDASLVRALAQLRSAAGSDEVAVGALAHTLKSSAASIGALGLSRACADVERRLRTGAPGDLQTDVERLLLEGEGALTAVRAMLQA